MPACVHVRECGAWLCVCERAPLSAIFMRSCELASLCMCVRARVFASSLSSCPAGNLIARARERERAHEAPAKRAFLVRAANVRLVL